VTPEGRDCTRCKEFKNWDKFGISKRGKNGRKSQCKSCESEYNKSRRSSGSQREYALRRRFNISLEEYEKILESQGRVCALCGKECSTGVRLAVDHDHESGHVRGLLCTRCNRFKLGKLTLADVRMLLAYLESPPAQSVIGIRLVPDDMVKPKKRRRKRRKRV
jgi:hypothetical protein